MRAFAPDTVIPGLLDLFETDLSYPKRDEISFPDLCDFTGTRSFRPFVRNLTAVYCFTENKTVTLWLIRRLGADFSPDLIFSSTEFLRRNSGHGSSRLSYNIGKSSVLSNHKCFQRLCSKCTAHTADEGLFMGTRKVASSTRMNKNMSNFYVLMLRACEMPATRKRQVAVANERQAWLHI